MELRKASSNENWKRIRDNNLKLKERLIQTKKSASKVGQFDSWKQKRFTFFIRFTIQDGRQSIIFIRPYLVIYNNVKGCQR